MSDVVAAAAVVPAAAALTVFGVSLGLRPDVLLAGFAGAIAAMALLNTVPSTGDTARELLRTSLRRVSVAVGSAVTSAYLAPLVALINNVPEELILSIAFLAGAGAMQMLPWLIERVGKRGKPGDAE